MVFVVAHSLLLNKESLMKTIPDREFRPVLIKHFKRVFNLRTSKPRLYKLSIKDNKQAIANLVQEKGNVCNAALFEVSDDEFRRLKLRNRAFYTKKVPVYNPQSGIKTGEGYIFIGRKTLQGEHMRADDILPIPHYLEMCRQGCYALGKQFGRQWDETTFLATGQQLTEYLNHGG